MKTLVATLIVLGLGWLLGRFLAKRASDSRGFRVLVALTLPLSFALPKALVVAFNMTGLATYSLVQVSNAVLALALTALCLRLLRAKPLAPAALDRMEWFLLAYTTLTVLMLAAHPLLMDITDMARADDGNGSGKSVPFLWSSLAAWHLSVICFAAALLRHRRQGKLPWRTLLPWETAGPHPEPNRPRTTAEPAPASARNEAIPLGPAVDPQDNP